MAAGPWSIGSNFSPSTPRTGGVGLHHQVPSEAELELLQLVGRLLDDLDRLARAQACLVVRHLLGVDRREQGLRPQVRDLPVEVLPVVHPDRVDRGIALDLEVVGVARRRLVAEPDRLHRAVVEVRPGDRARRHEAVRREVGGLLLDRALGEERGEAVDEVVHARGVELHRRGGLDRPFAVPFHEREGALGSVREHDLHELLRVELRQLLLRALLVGGLGGRRAQAEPCVDTRQRHEHAEGHEHRDGAFLHRSPLPPYRCRRRSHTARPAPRVPSGIRSTTTPARIRPQS